MTLSTKSLGRARWPVLAAALLATAASAGDAKCVFKAVGAGGLSFQGKTAEVSAKTEGANVVVTVVLKQLETGISLRDKHMKEKYLQVDKFPVALLTVTRSTLKEPSAADTQGEGSGTFTLHGVSKVLPFKYTASKGKDGISVSGTLRLNMNEFGVEVPSYLGVTVKPDIDVEAQFTFVP